MATLLQSLERDVDKGCVGALDLARDPLSAVGNLAAELLHVRLKRVGPLDPWPLPHTRDAGVGGLHPRVPVNELPRREQVDNRTLAWHRGAPPVPRTDDAPALLGHAVGDARRAGA